MKKVLQLSTYPIKNPLHGGQIRVSQISSFLKSLGCKVKSLSISENSHKDYSSENDLIALPHQIDEEISTPFCADYATFLLSSKDEYFNFIKNHTLSFNPGTILIEQPWLWGAVKRLKSENILKKDVKIYYSSQNVEYKIKQDILKQHQIEQKIIDEVVESIKKLEIDLIENSDGVISCTEEDALIFKEMGAKNILLAPNGVEKNKASDKAVEKVRDEVLGRKFIFFVGSAYPPNAIGFWEMLGDSLAWLPPEYLIVVAGGVGDILENYLPKSGELFKYVTFERIKKVGFLTNDTLNGFIEESTAIVLPITVGGGSNLKTAEAIISKKPVIATKVACRGYKFVDRLTDFFIVDSRDKFIEQTLKILSRDNLMFIDRKEESLRNRVLWRNTLKELSKICNSNN